MKHTQGIGFALHGFYYRALVVKQSGGNGNEMYRLMYVCYVFYVQCGGSYRC